MEEIAVATTDSSQLLSQQPQLLLDATDHNSTNKKHN
jgi:hypothetical protein